MKKHPRWLAGILRRIRQLAAQRKVRFTYKALRELADLDLGLDETDACHVLESLGTGDYSGRVRSRKTGEWMYIFEPTVGGAVLYVKLILRANCVVISFHDADLGEGAND